MQARMPCAAASADWDIRSTSPGLFSHLHAGTQACEGVKVYRRSIGLAYRQVRITTFAVWAGALGGPGPISHLHAGSLSKPVQVLEECCGC